MLEPSRRAALAALSTAVVFALLAVQPVASAPQSDERAVEIARATMQAMGGEQAWNSTRFISWKFMGGRLHVWDKWTGNHRIEQETRDGDRLVSLVNINTLEGRIFRNGTEVTDPEERRELINRAKGAWINDAYWMFMPYKLLDPGVTLKYQGEKPMEDGRSADVLQLTFDNVGNTPNNKYEVFVAKDSGLVEQWTHWSNADDPEPRFTLPWADWQRFGAIMLATNKGRDLDWSIHVYDTLPDSVFTDPEPPFQQ